MMKQTFVEYCKTVLLTIVIVAISAFFAIAQYFLSRQEEKDSLQVRSEKHNFCETVIIIDPGHGGEDGGAVGKSGTLEKNINLAIAKNLQSYLLLAGYNVEMTRTEDVLLYNENQRNMKKYYDVRNRVAFAKEYEDAIFVSIHQNTFPIEKYSGLQVYYSPNNPDSEKISNLIQRNTVLFLQPNNNRKAKEAGRNIYVLKELYCPAVLVECGFISNGAEEALLCDEEYRKRLAFVIFKSIAEFSEN